MDFAYVISKICSSEETQTFKKPSVSDLTEVSAPSYRTQIQPWEHLFLWPSTFPCFSLHPRKRPNAVNAPTHVEKPSADHLLNSSSCCEQAAQHWPSLILVQDLKADSGDCSSWKPNCKFWLLFHKRDPNSTVFIPATTQWLMVIRGRVMRRR